jgi:hypothetical protein
MGPSSNSPTHVLNIFDMWYTLIVFIFENILAGTLKLEGAVGCSLYDSPALITTNDLEIIVLESSDTFYTCNFILMY